MIWRGGWRRDRRNLWWSWSEMSRGWWRRKKWIRHYKVRYWRL